MNARASLVLLLLGACKPLPPRGNVATDLAAALPRLVLLTDPTAADVYFSATLAAGSAFDPVGQEGLAALTARSMVDSGAGSRDADALREALYVAGASLEVVVDKEWVTVRLRCHRDMADTCVELFTDVLVAPHFEEGAVKQVRDAAIYSLGDGLRDDEEALAYDVLDAWLYTAHPYGHPVAGHVSAVERQTPDDLRRFYRSHVVRGSTTIGVAGALDPTQVARLMDGLRALPTTLPPELVMMPPLAVKGRSLLVIDTGTDVDGFRLGAPFSVSRWDPDYPALLLAFTAFGSHRQGFGTLFQELRGKRGLNYGTYAYVEPFQERENGEALPEQGTMRPQTFWHLWVRPTAPQNAAFALKLAVAELDDFARDGLDAQTFEDTRLWLTGSTPLFARDPGRRLAYACEAVAAGTPDPIRLLPDALAVLTLDDVNAAIRRHVNANALRIVAVGGHAEELAASLQGTDPTPMHYAEGLSPDAEQAARDAEVAARSLRLMDVTVRSADDLFR